MNDKLQPQTSRSNDLSVYVEAIKHQDALRKMFMDFWRDPESQLECDALWRFFQKGAEAQRTLKPMPRLVNAEGSELTMILLNMIVSNAVTTQQFSEHVPEAERKRIVTFMVANGYRFVLGRWHKQEKPKEPT